MDVLDLALIVGLVVFGITGFRRGFIVGALGFAGFVGGGAIGMLLVPLILERRVVTVTVAGFALVTVLACASIGQALAAWLGVVLRSRVSWRPARQVDAAAGAVLSVVAMLIVTWFLALAVVQGPFPGLTRQVRDSQVLAGVDAVMPDGARDLFASFRTAVDDSVFPQVFGSLAPARVLPIGTPDAAIRRDPDVARAKRSIVEVEGVADACNESITGSGFVVAPERVVTNAHVVAGVGSLRVVPAGAAFGRRATVVWFDPKVDLAVLAVPGLRAPALALDREPLARGDDAAVIGFPGGGPYTVVAAKVRERQKARGRDIYDAATVNREVYALRAQVRPGNSGGPLLTPAGTVAGVVFAAAIDDPDTGYALTLAEVGPDIRAGIAATRAVDVGPCT